MFEPINAAIAVGSEAQSEALKDIAQKGYKTVIDLCTTAEGNQLNESEVKGLALAYVSVPVSPKNLSRETLEAFKQAINISPQPTYVRCASALRAGVFSLLMLSGALILGILLGFGLLNPPSAAAAIRQLEESPGQVVYQSRQTLDDQQGNSWQAIAFKRIRSDGRTSFALRLVGFPGVTAIDHSQPLVLTDSLGKTLTAVDDSGEMFTDEADPKPNVGQYNLQPVLSQLEAALPLQLTLPTVDGNSVSLTVSPTLIAEWNTVAGYE